MKLIIAGRRDFHDVRKLTDVLDEWTARHGFPDEVVCGMEEGADTHGYAWAVARDIPTAQFPADWKNHGKRAGPIRNRAMAEYADAGIVFWDGKSRGSKNMINQLRALNKKCVVIKPKEPYPIEDD